MLGRRQFRIKVLQALYAYSQGGESRLEIAEKNLLHSIDKFSELYYLLFSFLFEVVHYYAYRMEESKTKFYPTPEELNPSRKLMENRVLVQLQQNRDLQDKISKYKLSWTEEQDMVRKIYQKLKTSKDLTDYLNSAKSDYREDQEFMEKFFRKFLVKSSEFQSHCEERNIFWTDDFDIASVFVLKTMKLLKESFTDSDILTHLFVKDFDDDPQEDEKFIRELFRKTIIHGEELDKLIEPRTRNWELERIALTDIIL
ncbi:MAG: transcription antitermination factor NusB, partial [Bacteroidota bacterium]